MGVSCSSSGRIRVLIATTQGPVEIEAIIDLEPGDLSIVALGQGAEIIPGLKVSYRNFVGRGSGVIAKNFGHDAFRLELSGEIHAGDSWQLAVFIAHALHKEGRLAQKGDDASALIWATGQVNYNLGLTEIGHIREKLAASLARFSSERERGIDVQVIWPEANGADIDDTIREQLATLGLEVLQANHATHILKRLGLSIDAASSETEVWQGSPYRGLDAFGEADRAIFFGRGRAREEALEQLRTAASRGTAFLLIHGSSGAGKSSLARAGLLGDIAANASDADTWLSAVLPPVQPNRSPVQALAQALAKALPDLEVATENREETLARLIRAEPAKLVKRIKELLASGLRGGSSKLLLLIDQLEDTLFYGTEDDALADAASLQDRDSFAAFIERLAKSDIVWIIATLRSDLLAYIEDSLPLSRLATDLQLYRLERPNRAALRDMILAPARLVGLAFEGQDRSGTPLAEVLVEAAAHSPDSLPLLQFALARLYELRDRRKNAITLDAYERIGGLEGAIGRYAEDQTAAAFGDDPSTARALEDVILALARPGRENGKPSARTVVLDAFETPERRKVISAMRSARLVTLDELSSGGRGLRVTHDALLTHWPRAQMLLADRHNALELRDRLESEARAWAGREKDSSYLLQGGGALSAAEDLTNEGRIDLSAQARAFVSASAEAAKAKAEGELRGLRIQAAAKRRRNRIAFTAVVTILVLIGGITWLWRQYLQDQRTALFRLRELSSRQMQAANAASKAGNLSEAWSIHKSHLGTALAIAKQTGLVRDLRELFFARRGLSASLDAIGDRALRDGKWDRALAAYEESRETSEAYVTDISTETSERERAETLIKIGDVKSRLGDQAGALAAYERAIDILRGPKKYDRDGQAQRDLAHALMFAGGTEEARNIYLKPLANFDREDWNTSVLQDLAEMRRNGLTSPLLNEIEKKLSDPRQAK